MISALHKSIRGSDPDASLYWLARIFEGGEHPQFIARRLVRMATEDIGLADPDALNITLNAWRAYDQLGSPDGGFVPASTIPSKEALRGKRLDYFQKLRNKKKKG